MSRGPGRAPRGRKRETERTAGSRIHAGLVGRRELIGTPYLSDPDLRREYAADIAPRTGAALARIFDEVLGAGGLGGGGASPGVARSRVLDLGAGTGAAAGAARAFFGASIEVVSVDRVGGPGVVTADLAAPGPVRGIEGPFDLILAAHVLNELFIALPAPSRIAARAQKVRAWCEALLAPGGTFIVLEPALRETSRELLGVRDQLLLAGLRVVAPCLWAGPCPALARERDWCHDATPSDPDAGPRARRVDFSYLALRRAADPPSRDATLFRIVSDALVEKGRLRFFGCGPAGRDALVRLDRHRAAANAPFDDLRRGDVARIVGVQRSNDGWRLGADTVVGRQSRDYVPAE